MRNPSKDPDHSNGTTTNDAVALLKADHRRIEALFERCREAANEDEKIEFATQIAAVVTVHTLIEEEIFYPGCAEKGVAPATLEQALVEHGGIKLLIEDLLRGIPGDEFYEATITVLREYLQHHIGEEEREGDGIFAKARKAGVDMSAMGQRLSVRREALLMEPGTFAPPPQGGARHFQPQSPASRTAGWYADPFKASSNQTRLRRADGPDGEGKGHPDRGGWLEGDDPSPAPKGDTSGIMRDRDKR
jgi:hypothetical protein